MPPELKRAVAELLAARPGSRRAGQSALRQRYREAGNSAGIDLAAYLTARLPATYAAVFRVLSELTGRRPGFAPASVVDAGSGPGTASWAALSIWPELAAITMVDNDPDFLAVARTLAQGGPGALAAARFRHSSLTGALPRAQLAVAAYALAEIPETQQAPVIDSLWAAADDTLVLVEPGTPAGFERLRRARRQLVARGAVPVAPCPHSASCPMSGGDWCHFSVRLARSRAHMHAKNATVPFEDETFSYLIVARQGEPSGGARVLAPPETGKAGRGFKLCTAEGLAHRHIASRDRLAYKAHKKTGWGDLLDAR